MVAYSRSKVTAGYRTFSYTYYDDVEFDMLFGGKFAHDGLNISKGFVGYMLEIRLYSFIIIDMKELDD
jgi:hypothetical protein